MQLDKENIKKIRWLIAFAILLYLGVQNLHIVISTVRVLLGFLFPFIIGFGIAFILNIPMKFIEHHLFGKALKQEKKTAQKLARPVSLVLSICFVICIIVIVMLVVVPELGATFVNIAKKIEENIPVFQKWIDNVFGNNPEVVKWAQSLDIEPGKIIDSVLGVLKNGVNNIVSSTVSITIGLLTTAMNVSIGFVFACYVLLQKEKLLQQIKKAMYAMVPGKTGQISGTCMESGKQDFFQLYYRTVYRSCDSWKYVLCIHDNPAFSICNAGGCPDFIYSIDPAVWRNYRMLGSIFSDPYDKSCKSSSVSGTFPYPAADRRKPDLSSCGRWFCRASIHLGTGSCNTWRQSDGNCGNADLHSDSICHLYTFQRVGICPS